ncbi:MAG: hypothetical protein JW712_13985 [Dehalococcoidales bacterium]|nr:hypothetical protein [Dehalococcoidales bacterium]
MKIRASLLFTAFVLFAGLLPAIPAAAASIEVSLSHTAELDKGDILVVSVDISQVSNLNSAQFELYFNPEVIDVNKINDGTIDDTSFPVMSREIGLGHYRVLGTLMTGSANGQGRLAIITFNTLKGGTSELSFSDGILSGLNGEISAEWNSSSVTVISDEPEETDPPDTQQDDTPPAEQNDDSQPAQQDTSPPAEGTPTITTVDLTDTALTTSTPLRIDSTGTVQAYTTLTTDEGKVSYRLTPNTKVLDSQGHALTRGFDAVSVENAPAPPEGADIVFAYDMKPDGATFSPPVTLTMEYDEATLPEDTDENNLTLAYWNGMEWVILNGTVDAENNKISAPVTHFTEFAVIRDIPEDYDVIEPEVPEEYPSINEESDVNNDDNVHITQSTESIVISSGNDDEEAEENPEAKDDSKDGDEAEKSEPADGIKWPVLFGIIGGVVVIIILIVISRLRRGYLG